MNAIDSWRAFDELPESIRQRMPLEYMPRGYDFDRWKDMHPSRFRQIGESFYRIALYGAVSPRMWKTNPRFYHAYVNLSIQHNTSGMRGWFAVSTFRIYDLNEIPTRFEEAAQRAAARELRNVL